MASGNRSSGNGWPWGMLSGKGGGSAQLAQGGGLSSDRLRHALESVPTTLHER
ncbi:hypothetical protein [Streptomyces durhamensis]|uniref:hypothetical protein n=1 Tax=Streptomyces durhamensis TaxID=68194 RepID=UPI0012FE9CE8|nr:hypothetical protein [Streptomyces durhamensis]